MLVDDRERFERSILSAYPSVKKESIDRLVELSLQAEDEVRNFQAQSPELLSLPGKMLMLIQLPLKLRTMMKYSRIPGEEFLKSLFPGDELSGLRAALYMLALIKDFSAVGMLLYIGFALQGRAYQPRGGAYKAAEAFANAALRNGVEIRYSEKVSRIRLDGRQVRGITLESQQDIDSSCVVSAADIRQTFFQLLDPLLLPAGFRKKLESTPVSGTFVIVSIVTDVYPAAYGF